MKNIGSFTKIQKKTKQPKMNLNLMQESLLYMHLYLKLESNSTRSKNIRIDIGESIDILIYYSYFSFC